MSQISRDLNSFESEEQTFQRGEFMPLSIIRALWKRKRLIGVSWLLMALIGGLVVYFWPATYQARAVILIEQQRIPERFVASTVNEALENRLNRIAQLILAYEQLLRLIEEFNLYEDDRGSLVQEELVRKMRDNIDVGLVEGMAQADATAFHVTFVGQDSAVVAQITNRISGLFIDENIRTRQNQALGTTEFLGSQIREAEAQLDITEERLKLYREKFSGELPEQEAVLLSEARRLQADVDAEVAAAERAHQNRLFLGSALETATASLAMVKRFAAQEQSSPTTAAGASFELRQAQADLDRAEGELQSLRARYSANHPDIPRAETTVNQAREALERVLASAPPRAASGGGIAGGALSSDTAQQILAAEARINTLRVQIQGAEQEIASSQQRREDARSRLAMTNARLRRLPQHEQELSTVVRDYQTSMRNHDELLAKSFDANLAKTMEQREKAERFTMLEQARQPQRPIRPDRELLGAGVAAGSLLLAAVLGFGVELKSNVLLGEWELPAHVTVLGRVPHIELDLDEEALEDEGQGERAPSMKIQRRALITSSVVLSLAAVIMATGLYMGWISF